MSEDVREAQAMVQEPGLSEWEIATRRAIHECELQITSGQWSVHTIKHILEKAA